MEKIEINQGSISINPAGNMITVEEFEERRTDASNGEYALVVDDANHAIVNTVIAYNGYWCEFK